MAKERVQKAQLQTFVNYTGAPKKYNEQYRSLVKSHVASYNNKRRVKRAKEPPDEDSELNALLRTTNSIEEERASQPLVLPRLPQAATNTTVSDEDEARKEVAVRLASAAHELHIRLVNHLPIKFEGRRVPHLYDFFVHIWGPTYMWRAEMISEPLTNVQKLKASFLPFMLQDSLVFECLMGLCQAQLDWQTTRTPSRRPSKEVLSHYGNALKELRQRLQGAQCVKDNALTIAVMGLLALNYMYNNWRSFEANLKGLRQITTLRDQFKLREGFGFERYTIAMYELRWAHYVSPETHSNTEESRVLSYLEHPYSPQICSTISQLPDGFEELAMSKVLSVQVLELLGRVAEWTTKLEAAGGHRTGEQNVRALQDAKTCALLLKMRGMNKMEQLICTAVLAYLDPFKGEGGSPLRVKGLDLHTSKLRKLIGDELNTLEEDCTIWVAMVIAMVNDSEALPLPNRWLLLDEAMIEGKHTKSWSETRSVLRKFFWIDSFEERGKECWELSKRRVEGSGSDGSSPTAGCEEQTLFLPLLS